MSHSAWPVLVEVKDSVWELAKGNSQAIDIWGKLSEPFHGLLWQAGRALAKGGEVDPKSLLADCWKSASDKKLPGALDTVYDGFKVGERLQQNILLILATGGAAYAAKEKKWTDIWDYWSRWMGITGVALQEPTWLNGVVAEVWVEHVYQQARKTKLVGRLETLRYWTKHWLLLDTQRRREAEPSVEVPVAVVDQAKEGRMFRLCLERVKDATPDSVELIEHEDILLRPFGPAFVQTLQQVAEQQLAKREAGAVLWNLPNWGVGEPFPPIEGNSAGLGAAGAFGALSKGMSCDPRTLLLGAVNKDGSLEAVDGLKEKVPAALEAGIRRFGFAPRSDSQVARSLEMAGWEVKALQSSEEAIEFATQLAVSLRRYLTAVVELPDKAGGAPWLGDRKLTDIYVEPDLLKKENRRETTGERRAQENLGPESSEIGEETQPWSEEQDETETRKPWKSEFEALGEQPRMAVVVGPTGQGKTELIRMTARQMALKALQELTGSPNVAPKGIYEIDLPLAVKLNLLQDVSSEKQLLQILGREFADLVAMEYSDQSLTRYLERQVNARGTCLFLDAWDETEKSKDLKRLWRILEIWKCRVVITTRSFAYRELHIQKELVQAYRLAPFSDEQWIALVRAWFRDARTVKWVVQYIRNNSSVRGLARRPYLLAMICGVAYHGSTKENPTRTELYQLALPRFLGTADRTLEWMPKLEQIAWRMLLHSRNTAIDAGSLQEILTSRVRRPPVPLEFLPSNSDVAAEGYRPWKKELQVARLLVAKTDGAAYEFPHESFAEFLVGSGLARALANAASFDCALEFILSKSWSKQWHGVLGHCIGSLATDNRTDLIRAVLDRLSHAESDDYFAHRLALAAKCLEYIPAHLQASLTAQIDAIATSIWLKWWTQLDGWALPHLREIIPVLLNCEASLGDRGLTVQLERLTASHEPTDRVKAALTIEAIGNVEVPSKLLASIATLLTDSNLDVQLGAIGAAGKLVLANPGVIPSLAKIIEEDLPLGLHLFDQLRNSTKSNVNAMRAAFKQPAWRRLFAAWLSYCRAIFDRIGSPERFAGLTIREFVFALFNDLVPEGAVSPGGWTREQMFVRWESDLSSLPGSWTDTKKFLLSFNSVEMSMFEALVNDPVVDQLPDQTDLPTEVMLDPIEFSQTLRLLWSCDRERRLIAAIALLNSSTRQVCTDEAIYYLLPVTRDKDRDIRRMVYKIFYSINLTHRSFESPVRRKLVSISFLSTPSAAAMAELNKAFEA